MSDIYLDLAQILGLLGTIGGIVWWVRGTVETIDRRLERLELLEQERTEAEIRFLERFAELEKEHGTQ